MDILLKAGTPELAGQDWGRLPFILTILANCLWPIGWLYCNENKISFAESTMARGICTLIFSYIGCRLTDSPSILKYSGNFKLLLARSIFMTMHSFFTGLAQFILPLPLVHTIACSGTLFVFIIDYLMNGTKINSRQAIGIVIGIIGVLLASNGKLITKMVDPSYEYKTNFQNYLVTDPVKVSLFTLSYSGITILWAYGIVITRMAKSNTFQINFILGVVFYCIACLCLPYMPLLNYEPSSFSTMAQVVLFTGLPCFIVQILVITSLTMTKQTGVLNIMSFSMVFVSYAISIFRYHEQPNFVCSVGIALVLVGCFKTVMYTTK